MKKWFKAFLWYLWDNPIIFVIIAAILFDVVIVAMVIGATNGDFNAAQWVANPANPASPLY